MHLCQRWHLSFSMGAVNQVNVAPTLQARCWLSAAVQHLWAFIWQSKCLFHSPFLLIASSWFCHPLHCSCSVALGHFWVTWLSVAKLGSVAGRFCLVAASCLFLQWLSTHAVFWQCLMVSLWSMLRWMQPGTPVVHWFQLHFSWTHRFLQFTKPVLNVEPIFLRQSMSLGHVVLVVSLFLNCLNWRLTLLGFGTWFSTGACHHRSVCCQTLLCHCIQMKMLSGNHVDLHHLTVSKLFLAVWVSVTIKCMAFDWCTLHAKSNEVQSMSNVDLTFVWQILRKRFAAVFCLFQQKFQASVDTDCCGVVASCSLPLFSSWSLRSRALVLVLDVKSALFLSLILFISKWPIFGKSDMKLLARTPNPQRSFILGPLVLKMGWRHNQKSFAGEDT